MKVKVYLIFMVFFVLNVAVSFGGVSVETERIERLSRRLGDVVARHLSLNISEIEVNRLRLMNGLKSFPEGEITDIRPARPGRLLGRVLFVVTLSRAHKGSFEQWISADIRQVKKILVARHSLQRSDVIQKEDLDFQSIRVQNPRAQYETDPQHVIGKRLTRSLGKGMPIKTTQLEEAPVIQRGALVTIYFESGGLKIMTAGEAREEGQLGETIKIMNLDSRKIVFAKVFGAGDVRIHAPVKE